VNRNDFDSALADRRTQREPRAVGASVWSAWPWAAVAALLTVHALLAVDTLRQKAVTVDEVGHLPAGISYWQTGSFELYHHNPPLVKLLVALPALAAAPTVDYSKSWESSRRRGMPLSPWAFGWEFMYSNAARYHDIYFRARMIVVGLSVLTGALVFAWSRELFGDTAGLVAVALWTFCPNTIAHAGLVTTDMGATAIGFAATYAFWKYLRRPNWPRSATAGVLLGLAQLTKFSLLLLYLLWPLLWLSWVALRRADARQQAAGWKSAVRAGVLHGAAVVGISVAVINVGYLFEGSFTPLGRFVFLSRSLTSPRRIGPPPQVPAAHPWRGVLLARENRFAGTWLASMPVPLPRQYVEGFDEQKLESEGVEGGGYPVYLRGELRRTGWWWYYFYALSVKVPIGVWLVSLAAVIAVSQVSRKRAEAQRTERAARVEDVLVLLLPVAAVLFVMSFLTDINLGLRYVLPAFPYWFVLASAASCWLRAGRMAATAVLVPIAWNIVACVAISHPHHLAYFNELAGGRTGGHGHLLDSNIDWGQDLLGLGRWMREHRPGERVGLAYFGNVDPSILNASGDGFEFRLAPPVSLDDLEPVSLQPQSALRGAIERWAESHRNVIEQWTAANPGKPLWYMPAFRQQLVDALDLAEGPQPGLFAVSVNFLHGLPFRLRDHQGNIWDFARRSGPRRADPYGYFLSLQPIATIGGSILMYELSPDEAKRIRERAADSRSQR
jgi:4-amino-4-deoxy-L-arabinose transferase-like glycosyltransferase